MEEEEDVRASRCQEQACGGLQGFSSMVIAALLFSSPFKATQNLKWPSGILFLSKDIHEGINFPIFTPSRFQREPCRRFVPFAPQSQILPSLAKSYSTKVSITASQPARWNVAARVSLGLK